MKNREIIYVNGIKRFKENRIVYYCVENKTDMNQIVLLTQKWKFTIDELKEFYQIIWYSISWYLDIFEDKLSKKEIKKLLSP